MLLVGVGGACGSILRYVASRAAMMLGATAWPWGTLSVNIVGCFAAGFTLAKLAAAPADHPWRLFIGVGVLGGLTTFSAFSAETLALTQQDRWGAAALNIGANVIGSLLAAGAGFWLAR